MIVDRDFAVPMRDGVVLRADAYRPDAAAPVPALLLRTPYDRSSPLIPLSGTDVEQAVDSGYALVCQDVRGLHGSDGTFYPFLSEARDGYDTVEWLAAQPWCDGRVGMVGRSYPGTCQWLAAGERPPHLCAIAPTVIGSDFYRNWVYQGGAFQLGFNLFWVLLMSGKRGGPKPEELFRHLPLRDVPLPDPRWSFYYDWLDHSTDDEFWSNASVDGSYGLVEVPALIVGGWFDVFLGGTLENFVGLRSRAGSERAREATRLLVGPWAHGSAYGLFPDTSFRQYAPDDAIDFTSVQLGFFDSVLRGAPAAEQSPVRIFVMGANRWRDEDDWPLARARPTAWHLRADGGLAEEPPGDEAPDRYVYDPRDPAPTVGGPTSLPPRLMTANVGPLDQTKLEQRADVLVYTSGPLARPLEVTGPLTAVLYAATDALDTDFVVKLTEVWPDGRSLLLAEGVMRCRYREGFDRGRRLEPGAVHPYEIDLVATSNVFAAGNRIRVLVTSSSFPRFDRNANSGNEIGTDTEDDLRVARQTVFHDQRRPSHVMLPVVRR